MFKIMLLENRFTLLNSPFDRLFYTVCEVLEAHPQSRCYSTLTNTVISDLSDGKYFFPEFNFTQFVNRNVKILGRKLFSPSLSGGRSDNILIFHTFVCNFFP